MKKTRFGKLVRASVATKRAPKEPVVYELVSKAGRTQYIGHTMRNRAADRIEEHKAQSRIPFSRVGFIKTGSRKEAIDLETRLIRNRKPPFNRTGK